MARSWCGVNLWGAKWICGIRWRVDGLANIPADTLGQPHIVMAKHSSTWETLSLNQYFPPLAYVAKKELLSIPFFGWGFALASPITIDRKAGTDAMQQIAKQGRERFRQGFWIVVYPEGTRIRAGTRAKYKTGGARLAIAMNVPIIPVAHNAGYVWPKGVFGKRPGTITMTIGAPISPAGKDPGVAHAGSRDVDRERSRAAGRAAMTAVRTPVAYLRLDEVAGRGDARRNRDGLVKRITLGAETVEYRLIRARRRTIGMEVDLTGLSVRAPKWVTLSEIEAALQERAAWIVKALAEWRARRRDVMPREWKSGAPILYRGRELALEVFPARRVRIAPDLFHLTVLHPHAQDEALVAELVGKWLRDEAWTFVAPQVTTYAGRLTAAAPTVRLSNARSEWGSCNARGEIRLNWRLVQLPPVLAEYVVAHEVAHLVELNHSPRFWALVESLLPGHAALRRELEDWTALLAA